MPDSDQLSRFLFETLDIRGEIVQLDATWQAVLDRNDYPEALRACLGEAMAAAALLIATLKTKGALTLQIRGDGPVHLLVVRTTSERSLRGLARWKGEIEPTADLPSLFGNAHLVITIEPEKGERFQGIVPLTGTKLQDALREYFERSEQLRTRLWLTEGNSIAAGLLLQTLPGESEDDDAWNRVTQLAATITDAELQALPVADILHRLFHEEDIRLFESAPLRFECSCSREKITTTLQNIGEAEVNIILEEAGVIDVDCQFCGSHYQFDSVDIRGIFNPQAPVPGNTTLQ
ncbi:MAG TPA: Hsp33 family molecular chaperone HslO [Gammaproteobacteria bacterium]|nr:Hsp33 family molecular chaperone HslO [Gammaproteobacteria bacterium]